MNEAADNVGRVAQVDNLEEQVRGYYRAAKNAYEGIQVARTGDAMLAEVSNLLINMRSLAVKSGTDSMNDADRHYLHEGFIAYRDEIQSLTKNSEVFGIALASEQSLRHHLQIEKDAFKPLALKLRNLTTRTNGSICKPFDRYGLDGRKLNRGELKSMMRGLGVPSMKMTS